MDFEDHKEFFDSCAADKIALTYYETVTIITVEQLYRFFKERYDAERADANRHTASGAGDLSQQAYKFPTFLDWLASPITGHGDIYQYANLAFDAARQLAATGVKGGAQ